MPTKRKTPRVRYSRDFPIAPEGATTYLLKGIAPELLTAVNLRRKAKGLTMRHVMLTLLTKYSKGEIDL